MNPVIPQGRARPLARDWRLSIVLAGTAALLGFAKVGEDVLAHESTGFDGAVRAWMLAHHHPVAHRLFVVVTTMGGITGMRVLALAGAAFLWLRRRRAEAAGVLVVPFLADVLFNLIKRIYARPRPAGLDGRVDGTYAFPSGHGTVSAAVCCTLAYVLWRDGFLRGWIALTLAIGLPLLVGVSRLYLDVHWATDVLGGWCLGLLVAVLVAALHDHFRRRQARNRGAPARVESPITPSSTQ